MQNAKRIGRKRSIKQWIPLYLMFLPGAIYLIINNYMPMVGIVLAFKKYDVRSGIFGSPWSGLSNFRFLFSTGEAWIITRNTVLYNAAFIAINTIVGIALAIMICDVNRKALKKLFQSVLLFPYLMSSVILGYIVYGFLSSQSGIMNKTILPFLGLDPVRWYYEPSVWPAILIIVNTWKGVGYGCLIYISNINAIDPSYYEAAQIDGAKRWDEIRYITLPELLPSIILMTLLSVSKIFNSDFGLFYQVPRNSGMLYSTTNTIDTYVYRALMQSNNFGLSAAAGFYQSIVGFTLVMLTNTIIRRVSNENALF